MTIKKLEELAVIMGLKYNSNDNFKDSKLKGIRVFNGINSQRVLIDSNWSDNKIYKTLGNALIEYGERQKAQEITRALNY